MSSASTVSLVFPVDAVKTRLNTDAEFGLMARYWYTDIRFFIDDDQYFLRIEDGKVRYFQHGTHGFDPYTINIGGPAAVWQKMMEETPQPFYHDFFAASLHHGFTCGGDIESLYAYYGAVRRILEIIRAAVRAARVNAGA